jgi:hypothetical protein
MECFWAYHNCTRLFVPCHAAASHTYQNTYAESRSFLRYLTFAMNPPKHANAGLSNAWDDVCCRMLYDGILGLTPTLGDYGWSWGKHGCCEIFAVVCDMHEMIPGRRSRHTLPHQNCLHVFVCNACIIMGWHISCWPSACAHYEKMWTDWNFVHAARFGAYSERFVWSY